MIVGGTEGTRTVANIFRDVVVTALFMRVSRMETTLSNLVNQISRLEEHMAVSDAKVKELLNRSIAANVELAKDVRALLKKIEDSGAAILTDEEAAEIEAKLADAEKLGADTDADAGTGGPSTEPEA